jgi:hypothetical protein
MFEKMVGTSESPSCDEDVQEDATERREKQTVARSARIQKWLVKN